MHLRQKAWIVDKLEFVGQRLLDYFFQLVAVVRQPEKVGRAYFESFDDGGWRAAVFCDRREEVFALQLADLFNG